jgi:hypothetical protein
VSRDRSRDLLRTAIADERCFNPITDLQFVEKNREVVLDRLLRQKELSPDFLVAEPVSEMVKDLLLPNGQR